jgi:hypothetical protein
VPALPRCALGRPCLATALPSRIVTLRGARTPATGARCLLCSQRAYTLPLALGASCADSVLRFRDTAS